MANSDHKTIISHKSNISTNMCGLATSSQDTLTFTFSLLILFQVGTHAELRLLYTNSRELNYGEKSRNTVLPEMGQKDTMEHLQCHIW